MGLYVFSYFINAIASPFAFRRGGWFLFSLVTAFLVFVLGFRGVNVGIDTSAYYYSFGLIESGEYTIKDPLYFVFSKALSSVGLRAESVILLFALITIAPLSFIIYRESPYPVLSFSILLAFGFYAAYFNIMRQGAAMTLGIVFVYYLVHGAHVKAFTALIVAVFMHLSAVVLFPVYVIYSIPKIFSIWILVSLWMLSLVSAASGVLFYYILLAFELFVPDRFLFYLSINDASGIGLSFFFEQFVFLFIFFVYLRTKDKAEELYLYLGAMGVVALYLFFGVQYVDRLALFYFVFCVFSLPICFSKVKGSAQRGGLIFIFMIFLFALFLYRASVDPHKIFPYTTIFG